MILLFCFNSVLYALTEKAKITIVYRKDIKIYRSLVKRFKEEFDVIDCPLPDKCSQKIINESSLVISFGDSAARYLCNFKKKFLAFFLSDRELLQICSSREDSVFYFLFPTYVEVLKRLEYIFPDNARVAILYSNNSKYWLENIAYHGKFSVAFEQISTKEIADSLREIFEKDYNFFVLVPDYLFLQRKVLREIVKFSYIFQKPVIGFSSQMLKYGLPIIITYDLNIFIPKMPTVIKNFSQGLPLEAIPMRAVVNRKSLFYFKNIKLNRKFLYE